jgi:VanZ family protein
MKKPGVIVLKHLSLWLLFSAVYMLCSEYITKLLFSGMDYDVEQWIVTTIGGLVVIFVMMVVFLIINLRRALRS